jgi:CheY-like chemotaxis protein
VTNTVNNTWVNHSGKQNIGAWPFYDSPELSGMVDNQEVSGSVSKGWASILPKEQRMQILLAEDDLILQQYAKIVLERCGYSVTVVADGQEAVDAFSHAHYDLVLMDIQMPIMDGFMATAAIRRAEKSKEVHTPIIAFTSYDKSDSIFDAGMDGYLGKPATPESLVLAVQSATRRSR